MTTARHKKYNYPSPKNYSEEVHTDEGVKRLVGDSLLEKLLSELEDDGVDVSGPRAEFIALKNFVTYSARFKDEVKNHALFIVEQCE
ncbi:hypothetical protein PEC302107_36150 [Pectobacterium araliae]|uniref:hypothetical protein n=1 Tax=Pectobacterium araliae TaxID=3073862 RepID=UPI0020807820|nr:hypothetical protein PEC302107_36150 [Pectobacterium carotovorum subsp. carotovorum]